MAYQRYSGYSGQEYDRWVGRNSNNSAMGKVQKQFWFTKSAVLRKFGRKEDEHIVASDAELDSKIDLFNTIEETTKELRSLIADYQTRVCMLAQEENSLGKLLKEYGKQDQTKAGKMMVAIGKSLNCTAQHRVGMRTPLVRLYQEVDTFHLRAVEDTHRTVEEMEKVRTEYRGALMWMKNISQDFNPDHYQQLEKFREVQAIVKRKKGRFDILKVKCLQKIDLLAASRCNMFSHALIVYQNNLITFSEKTAKTLNDISSRFKDYEPYKFKVIKELSDPLDDIEENIDSDKNQAKVESLKKNNGHSAEMSEDESLINLSDQSEDLPCDPTVANDFSNIDLLTDSISKTTDSENAQLLKELFDSPVHSYQKVHTLPIFGCSGVKSVDKMHSQKDVIGHNNESKNNQQFFLPSQLLDFGFICSETQSNETAGSLNLPKGRTSTVQNTTKISKMIQSFQDGESSSKVKNVNQTNKENSKLDWYKVFQEIDPLTDAGNSIFLKGYDNKQC